MSRATYSSPEIPSFSLHLPGVCDGDPRKSIEEACESVANRIEDIVCSKRRIKRIKVEVEFHE